MRTRWLAENETQTAVEAGFACLRNRDSEETVAIKRLRLHGIVGFVSDHTRNVDNMLECFRSPIQKHAKCRLHHKLCCTRHERVNYLPIGFPETSGSGH